MHSANLTKDSVLCLFSRALQNYFVSLCNRTNDSVWRIIIWITFSSKIITRWIEELQLYLQLSYTFKLLIFSIFTCTLIFFPQNLKSVWLLLQVNIHSWNNIQCYMRFSNNNLHEPGPNYLQPFDLEGTIFSSLQNDKMSF